MTENQENNHYFVHCKEVWCGNQNKLRGIVWFEAKFKTKENIKENKILTLDKVGHKKNITLNKTLCSNFTINGIFNVESVDQNVISKVIYKLIHVSLPYKSILEELRFLLKYLKCPLFFFMF